ncbi:hypothetical protein ALC62_03126 [Cyphomyrmex costatus]|uniref:Odorant receptor 13a n=1 Tax=Cyphomyrmex costatus TaxID=456900 RepID=A0A151IM37_9HYME|nr:hypothetical protein ALC62_03126 [Cyphomyrmex costatus]
MWAIQLHRIGFEMVGLWPKSNKRIKKNLSEIWAFIIFILLIFFCNIPMICAVVQVWGNMVFVIKHLQTTLPLLIASIKYVIIRRKQTVLLSIINMMAEDWITFKQDKERNVMIKRAQTARSIMMIGYVLMVIAALTITILPCFGISVIDAANLTGVHKPLPLTPYHFYNTDKSPQFELTFFIHSLTTLLAGTIYMCVDIFLVLTVLHICGQLENFRYRLINLISYKNYNKVLNDIVRTHLRLIRYLIAVNFYKNLLDFMWAVNLHRFGFEMMGLWPKSNKSNKKNLVSEIWVGIIFVLLVFISNIPMMCAVIQVWGNMIFVINNLQTTLPLLIASVKYAIIRRKKTVLLSIVNTMAEDWATCKLDRERDVMVKRARTARLIMMIGYVLVMMTFLTVTILSCFGIQITYVTNSTDRRKFLPLATYNFYDINKSPQFELTFFIHSVTILLATTIYMSVDIFLILIILHICGQLENFRFRLINLISCKNFNKVLNNIVATHLRLIRFVDNIESTYSLMMLVLVFHFGIVFCLRGFLFTIIFVDRKIIKDKAIIAQGYFSILIIIILLMNTLLYCGAGELVTDQVSQTHNK